jgi:DNA-3-methyladenine glycosylase
MPSGRILEADFFARPTALVARELLGMALVRRQGRARRCSMIIETEAYLGPHDLASHSSRGRTARTEVMFGPAGRFYVYRIYGLHWMLNIVTGGNGRGAAVLIRGIACASGPARLTAAMNIDGSFTGLRADPRTGLWFEDTGACLRNRDVLRTPRIGVDYAGPIWAQKKLRYVVRRDRVSP